jgi:branched-chain amino acid aminotransferase
LGRHKTTSRLAYHLARDEARAAGADEALLVTAGGEVLEGTSSNLFAVIGGEVLTPRLSAGILPGITRALVLRTCAELGIPARECALERDQVIRADEIFLTSSVQEVVPLSRVDGREIPERQVGTRLLSAYRESVAATP